jgi:hypothetical protein
MFVNYSVNYLFLATMLDSLIAFFQFKLDHKFFIFFLNIFIDINFSPRFDMFIELSSCH